MRINFFKYEVLSSNVCTITPTHASFGGMLSLSMTHCEVKQTLQVTISSEAACALFMKKAFL